MISLDSRTWLLWGLCCIVPMLVTRHPLLVLQMLFIVVTVRLVCIPPHAVRWGWIIQIAMLFAAIGVVINALTVRSGNQIAVTLPWGGWDITWNAIAYGIVSGFAMVCLVLIGTTTAAGLDWVALVRVLPARLAPLAVSASVAWSFLPSASQALTDIREAQAARGHTLRSGRDTLPILIPLLDGSLGRALTMSEALEARGFGAAGASVRKRGYFPLAGMVLIASLALLAYGLSLANTMLSYASTVFALAAIVMMLKSPAPSHRSTRYREHLLTRPDVVVMVAAAVSLISFLALYATSSQSVTFNPYPNLEVPAIDVRILIALMPLLAPALFPYREVAQ